jgi:hypothetical protein
MYDRRRPCRCRGEILNRSFILDLELGVSDGELSTCTRASQEICVSHVAAHIRSVRDLRALSAKSLLALTQAGAEELEYRSSFQAGLQRPHIMFGSNAPSCAFRYIRRASKIVACGAVR